MTQPEPHAEAMQKLVQKHADERAAWHSERERLRRDRERTSWLLVEAEQRIASLLALPTIVASSDSDVEIETLRRTVHELRSSTSWRATRPLRAITGRLRKPKP